MTLTDTGHTAEYQQLVDQHQQYEELMQELFLLYQSGSVIAPCDGIVTGVDTDGAYLPGRKAAGLPDCWALEAAMRKKAFWHFRPGRAGNGRRADFVRLRPVPGDFRSFPGVFPDGRQESLTQSWTYTGSTRLYSQTEDGLLEAAGTAQPGIW